MTKIEQMIVSLDHILAHHRHLGRVLPSLLQPGLAQTEITSWESKLPFSFTLEVEAIYRWRNGTKAATGDLLESLSFSPGFYFLSIDEAIQTYMERENSPQWRKGWFPIFADGAGDFYLVICDQNKLETTNVVGFIHGEPEQSVEYESLSAMIQTIEAGFAEGAFFLDDDNSLEIDDEKFRNIAQRFNPGVQEWQS